MDIKEFIEKSECPVYVEGVIIINLRPEYINLFPDMSDVWISYHIKDDQYMMIGERLDEPGWNALIRNDFTREEREYLRKVALNYVEL